MGKVFFKWFFGGAALCALLGAAYLLVAGMINDDGRPASLFGFSGAVVTSGSMSGTLEVDDLIVFSRREGYEVGDVVTFQTAAGLVTHRIVAETDRGFTTQGDANNTPDQDTLLPLQIQGEVVGRIPRIGALVRLVRAPLGLALLLGVGVALLVVVLWPAKKEVPKDAQTLE